MFFSWINCHRNRDCQERDLRDGCILIPLCWSRGWQVATVTMIGWDKILVTVDGFGAAMRDSAARERDTTGVAGGSADHASCWPAADSSFLIGKVAFETPHASTGNGNDRGLTPCDPAPKHQESKKPRRPILKVQKAQKNLQRRSCKSMSHVLDSTNRHQSPKP